MSFAVCSRCVSIKTSFKSNSNFYSGLVTRVCVCVCGRLVCPRYIAMLCVQVCVHKHNRLKFRKQFWIPIVGQLACA